MMAKKQKTLCAWKREEIQESLEELRKIVCDPRFVCKRCGRAVSKRKWVCKPESLKK
jgi:hypothetical protein